LSFWEAARGLHFSAVYWRYNVLANSPQDRILWANTMRPGSFSACERWEKTRETSNKASKTAARIAVLRVPHKLRCKNTHDFLNRSRNQRMAQRRDNCGCKSNSDNGMHRTCARQTFTSLAFPNARKQITLRRIKSLMDDAQCASV